MTSARTKTNGTRLPRPPARARTLRIGIASPDQMRERTMAIARGDVAPKSDDPKVWVQSGAALWKVLSGRNQELVKLIRARSPESLQALSHETGRALSN